MIYLAFHNIHEIYKQLLREVWYFLELECYVYKSQDTWNIPRM